MPSCLKKRKVCQQLYTTHGAQLYNLKLHAAARLSGHVVLLDRDFIKAILVAEMF